MKRKTKRWKREMKKNEREKRSRCNQQKRKCGTQLLRKREGEREEDSRFVGSEMFVFL